MVSSELVNTLNIDKEVLFRLLNFIGYYSDGEGSGRDYFIKKLKDGGFLSPDDSNVEEKQEDILVNYRSILEYWIDVAIKNPYNLNKEGHLILSNFEREIQGRMADTFWTDWNYIQNPVNKSIPFVVVTFYNIEE